MNKIIYAMFLLPLFLGSSQPSRNNPSQKLNIVVEKGNWGSGSTRDRQKVCYSAAMSLWIYAGDRRKLDPIRVTYSKDGPRVLFKRGPNREYIVELDNKDRFWAQCAFQFAHEFCHILCNYRDRKNPQKWFEESLCECASLYALLAMGKKWKSKPPYANWKNYSKYLTEYANNRISRSNREKIKSLADWYQENRQALEKDPYLRNKNEIVACRILPLLQKNPQHWKAVRYLNLGPGKENRSFQAYLEGWHRRVPHSHKPFVKEVAGLFGLQIK